MGYSFLLMLKMPHTRKNHSNAMFIASVNRILVAQAAAGLDNNGYPGFGGFFYRIRQREHRV